MGIEHMMNTYISMCIGINQVRTFNTSANTYPCRPEEEYAEHISMYTYRYWIKGNWHIPAYIDIWVKAGAIEEEIPYMY